MPLLDAIIYGVRDVLDSANNLLPRRSRIRFLNSTVEDNQDNDTIDVTPTGGGGGGGGGGILVFQPAIAESAAPIYKTWAEVEAAINALGGACELVIDGFNPSGSAVYPVTIPATAALDGRGRLKIRGAGYDGETSINFDDGGQIKNVQSWSDLFVQTNCSVRSPVYYDLEGMIIECRNTIFSRYGDGTKTSIGFADSPTVTYFSLFLHGQSLLTGGAFIDSAIVKPIVNVGAGVSAAVQVDTAFDAFSSYGADFDDRISGPNTASLAFHHDLSVNDATPFPAFLGTITRINIDLLHVPTGGFRSNGTRTGKSNQSVASGVTDVALTTWGTPSWLGPGITFDGTSFTVAQAGKYMVTACIGWSNGASDAALGAGQRTLKIASSFGDEAYERINPMPAGFSGVEQGQSLSVVMALDPDGPEGASVHCAVQQNSGVNVDVNPISFTVTKLLAG